MMAGSAATSRVFMPLPTSTASAPASVSRPSWASIVSPFMEVTLRDGLAMRTANRHPPQRDAVEHAEGDQRIQVVEAVEGQDGDAHGGQATSCRASPKALTRRSISVSVLMKGGASWMVSPP